MISSEVQRTLVKSPPELWAELSDPSSLARHLGELGDIRITRAEPEKLVEWEAEDASGTVAIKASGWGTKVTLTANREFEPPAETSATADADSSVEEAALTVTAAARFGHEHSESLLGGDLELAAQREEPPVEEIVAASEPLSVPVPAAETEPAPEPQALAEPETVPEVLAEPAPAAELEDFLEQLPQGASEEPEAEAGEDTAPEPRPGFFARLFGRRRHQAVSAPVPSEPVAQQPPAPEPVPEAPAPLEPAAVAAVGEPVWVPELEREPEPVFVAQPEPDDPEATVPERPSCEAETGALDGEGTLEAEAVSAPAETRAPEQAMDLAAELRAAEEAAEAEVTEILKGVLDRLGAAHHRPFSRS